MLDVVNYFTSSTSLDMSKMHEVKYAEVYLVEIQNIEKTLLLHIRKLLSDKTDSLIFFFIEDSQNLMLFQLATLLNVKSIFTPKHETQKIISSIDAEILLKKTTAQDREIVGVLSNTISFMVFDKDSLVFASKRVLDEFESSDLLILDLNLCSKIDLKPFLKNDMTKEQSISLKEGLKHYSITSIGSKISSNRYIFIQEILQNEGSIFDNIKNRIFFIEALKERLFQKKQKAHSIITMSIENIAILEKFWGGYEIEMAIGNLLLQIELDQESILAQYNNKLYIALLDGIDFEDAKKKAHAIQRQLEEYSAKEEIKPTVGLYVFDINGFELNDVLKIVSDISKDKISSINIEGKKIYSLLNIDSNLDEESAIDQLLQSTFVNNTPLKLLNIYKGLCINTPSVIVKKTQDEIYVNFEHLQGIVMNFEKETILQSADFTKDIAADVKLIDLKKKIALLKNFRFVNGSAIGRKYSRVTPSQRTPISIITAKGSLSGEILDISMNSIAIKTRLFKNIEELDAANVELRFTLPIRSSEAGYMKLELDAKASFSKCGEDYCKIVMDIEETQAHESILMEYVYDRQKEIITELKKQTIIRS